MAFLNNLFGSFAQINGIFSEATELAPEDAVAYARQFEADGTDAKKPRG
jgi:hypothetical protein